MYRLVSRGYIVREPIPENRRSIRLICTEQANSVIEGGHKIQKKFFGLLYNGIDPSDLETFRRVLDTLTENVLTAKDSIKRGDLQ